MNRKEDERRSNAAHGIPRKSTAEFIWNINERFLLVKIIVSQLFLDISWIRIKEEAI